MKVIIAGSRKITNYFLVESAILTAGFEITEIVSGGCSGVDKMGERWAYRNSVPIKIFPADWKTQGNKAGPMRNKEMAAYANALIAVWDGKSSGTKNMISEALKNKLEVHIKYLQI